MLHDGLRALLRYTMAYVYYREQKLEVCEGQSILLYTHSLGNHCPHIIEYRNRVPNIK